jgi:hypothetical protein
MTRKAAVDAGFGSRDGDKLMLIDEPQAGIIDVLKTKLSVFAKDQQPFEVRKPLFFLSIADVQLGWKMCPHARSRWWYSRRHHIQDQ